MLVVKNLSVNAGNVRDAGSIPWSAGSPGGGHATLLFLPRESPWTEETGRLQSVGSHRVGHD